MNLSSEDRQFLNAAITLKETYDSQSITPTNSVALPHERWKQLQRLTRQIQAAEQHGFDFSARRCHQRFNEQLRFTIQELNGVESQLAPTLRTHTRPSLRFLYEELRSLSDEFIEVDVDRVLSEIVVTTERITLEDNELGAFEIRLSIAMVTQAQPYKVVAISPNPAQRDDSITHPHVQSESLCEGDGTHAINNALAEGRLCDFFLTVRQILRTYNPSSAYVSLDEWTGVSCGDCGDFVNTDESYCCERCEGPLCDRCTQRCHSCELTHCYECSEICKECDERCCRDCLTSCQQCDCSTCNGCLEDELCSSCQTLNQEEEDDAKSENSPSNPPTPTPTTTETTRQTETSHNTVQSPCVGEAPVPT